MRALLACLTVTLLGLAACNANPLLKAAASDYAPVRLGGHWDYRSPDGATSLARTVSAAGVYQGLDAFVVDSDLNGVASQSHIAFKDGDQLQYNASLGWILSRRLPLVNGNQWPVPTGNSLVTTHVVVDGLEKVSLPMGDFDACFKIRTVTETYNAGSDVTTTATTLAWAAPGIGDVRYATVAADGSVTTSLQLVGYTIP